VSWLIVGEATRAGSYLTNELYQCFPSNSSNQDGAQAANAGELGAEPNMLADKRGRPDALIENLLLELADQYAGARCGRSRKLATSSRTATN